MSKHKT